MFSNISLSPSFNLSRNLVFWGVCLALFQQLAPRGGGVVHAATPPSTSFAASKQVLPESNSIFDKGTSPLSENVGGESEAENDLEQNARGVLDATSDTDEMSETSVDSDREDNAVSEKHENTIDSPGSLPAENSAIESDKDEDTGDLFCEENEDDGTVGMIPDAKENQNASKEQKDMTLPSVMDEVVVSDAEAEWFDSDDSSAETIPHVTVDMTTVKEEHVNIKVPHGVAKDQISVQDETEVSDPSGIVNESESESESDEEEGSLASQNDDSNLTAQAQEAIVEEIESESDDEEEEATIAPSEADSDAETTSEWSEGDESTVSDDEAVVVEELVEPSPPRQSDTSATLKDPQRPTTFTTRSRRKDSRITPVAASAAAVPPRRRRKGRTLGSSRQYGSPNDFDPSSQPLKTLEKLQNMLDETDYMTAARGSRSDGMRREAPPTPETVAIVSETGNDEQKNEALIAPQSDPIIENDVSVQGDKLWTSKDRMKYKKQQQRIRRAKQEQKRLQEQLRSPPVHPNSSDDDASTDDTDDGLGYTLPNLPVFFSDAEGTTTDLTDMDHPSALHQGQVQHPLQPPPPPFEQRGTYQYPPPPGYYPLNVPQPPDQNMGQAIPPYYPPNPYGPYGTYGPYNQQQMASQYAAWAASAGVSPYSTARPPYRRPYSPQAIEQRKADPVQPSETKHHDPKPVTPEPKDDSQQLPVAPSVATEQPYSNTPVVQVGTPYQLSPTTNTGSSSSLVEAGSNLSFDSIQKMSVLAIGTALLCYCAVSPRTLPPVEYNAKFYENVKIVSLMMIAPILTFLMVFDPKENDINNDVNAFYVAFTVGYSVSFLLEIIFTTAIRLGIFAWLEPDVFELTPRVPSLVLPWVLRENRYRPKRITLFVADFVTSCVACPIIEEYVKLKTLQWSARLPRNFKWTTKASSKNKKKKRRRAEAIPRYPGDPEVTNVNAYVSQMLAVSLGIKLCDSTRRTLMYTKDTDENKGFYALCRGIFPIQELCGTMTALALAKRDVLGWDIPLWKMLAPAVVIHGMANFRGMKPIFKWNSATPWSEMQLLPWNAADDSTLPQLMNKGFAKLMWLIILGRVLGYCIKNYYLIRRQAVKRTTTYAGKRAAFSAELAATEMLKKTAKD